jgi:hypothetical protein
MVAIVNQGNILVCKKKIEKKLIIMLTSQLYQCSSHFDYMNAWKMAIVAGFRKRIGVNL